MSSANETNNDVVHQISLSEIDVDKNNIRTSELEDGIEDLSLSIKEIGQLQPVVLVGTFGRPPYSLIIGQRRYLAHKLLSKKDAKYKKIRAIFIDKPKDNIQAKVISLAENMHRKSVSYDDMATAITAIYNKYEKVQTVAKLLGVSTSSIYEYLKIEKFKTPKIDKLLKSGKLNKEDVKRLIKMTGGNKTEMDKWANEYEEKLITPTQKIDAERIKQKDPKKSLREVFKTASKPKYRDQIILTIDKKVGEAFKKAEAKLGKGRETIAYEAVENWLIENGFYK